ncbi:MAG: hypothetical protein LBF41_07865 [Deltaproteobacteria bacterium]|jgi:hypothetical protein|nr:hypothetical protein [Deltaproteobacteria bacterium]
MPSKTPASEINREFRALWTCAMGYVRRLSEESLTWFKGNLNGPIFEHFSFRLGNQLFFVRLEDSENRLHVPGTPESLFEISEACDGHPLVMPMRYVGGLWLPTLPGWGLKDARTGEPVNPKNLVTSELIRYTDWELHDMAVHTVALTLGKRKLHTITNHPAISPSIWYDGDSGLEWIMVRYARHPESDAPPPANWAQICESCFERGAGNGYFAVVVFAEKDPRTGLPAENMPLHRGADILINYQPFRLLERKDRPLVATAATPEKIPEERAMERTMERAMREMRS